MPNFLSNCASLAKRENNNLAALSSPSPCKKTGSPHKHVSSGTAASHLRKVASSWPHVNLITCLMIITGLFVSVFASAQTAVSIRGTVIDEKGAALGGVTVVVKGTTAGTSTDSSGRFSIDAKTGDRLVFSRVGYSANEVLKLERLRGRPEGPFVYFISYFHPRVGLTGEEDFKRPLYEILEKEYSVIANLSKEEISAKGADKFISAKLGVEQGSPILFRKRFVFDQGDRPIEYNLGYYRGDSFVYNVDSRRE